MNVHDGIVEEGGALAVHIVIEGIACPRRAQMIRAAVLQEIAKMLALETAQAGLMHMLPAGRA